MAKNNKTDIHRQRWQEIKPYVNFKIDARKKLTAAQKRKIKKYYDEYNALTARPFQPYKTADKKKLNKAKDFAGQDKNLRGFTTAFIPTPGEEKVKVKFDKAGKMRIATNYVSTEQIDFDPWELEETGIEYVKDALKDSDSKSFTIMAGKYEIPKAFSKSTIARNVMKYVTNKKYSDPAQNHYFGNWLHGVYGHTFTNQGSITDYLKEKSAARQKLRRERRNKKARQKRRRKK